MRQSLRFQVLDHQGVELPLGDGLVLTESANYTVRATGLGQLRAWLGEIELRGTADGLHLWTGHYVGDNTLRVAAGDAEERVPVRIESRSDKLPPDLWCSLLTELEQWLPGLGVGVGGARAGEVGREGVAAPLVVEALLPLLGPFERALRAVLSEPRHVAFPVEDDVPLRNLRSVHPETLRWATRHPTEGAWLHPWRAAELSGPEPWFPHRTTRESLNHPANRYVSWLCQRIVRALRGTQVELARLGQRQDDDSVWCLARAARVGEAADHLETLWRRSWLLRVRPAPPSEAALLVILDDPTYSRVHSLGRRFLAPLFSWTPDRQSAELSAAVRPSFTLYELWCLLELQRQLRATLPDWQWKERGLARLLRLEGTGGGAGFVGTRDGHTLHIEFNPTFGGYLDRGTAPRYSISGARRPDLVVRSEPVEGAGSWIALDAKYRVGPRNLADAFESVHIYRDALIDERCAVPGADPGRPRAVVLLAPSADSLTAPWFSEVFLERFGSRVFKLRPGGNRSDELGRWVADVLAGSNADPNVASP